MVIKINEHLFKIKLAISEKEKQIGMMKKRFDENYNGMLFLQGKGDHCFWMMNCIIPLDIIFIKDNQITKIHHNCPPCTKEPCKNYCGNGEMVLELQGGTCKKLNIEEKNILEFVF
jgi:uncharacterized membrane protein (UPF0127 family)